MQLADPVLSFFILQNDDENNKNAKNTVALLEDKGYSCAIVY